MTPEMQVAYINAQTAAMLCELEGMKAANAGAALRKLPPAYNSRSFMDLPARYGLDANTVLAYFTGR